MQKMTLAGNPAQRLHDLLVQLLALRADSYKSARDAWGAVLGLSPSQQGTELMRAFGGVYELPDRIREWLPILGKADEDVEEIDRQLRAAETALANFGMHGTLQHYKESLRPDVMQGLKFAAGAIRRQGGRDLNIEQQALDELFGQVHDLVTAVEADESLNAGVRAFALKHLYSLERALRDLQIYGVEALQDVVNRFVGEIAVAHAGGDADRADFIRATPIGQKIWGLVAKVATLTNLGTGLPELVSGIERAIGA